eukprot:862325-Amphidinium_carterae.2
MSAWTSSCRKASTTSLNTTCVLAAASSLKHATMPKGSQVAAHGGITGVVLLTELDLKLEGHHIRLGHNSGLCALPARVLKTRHRHVRHLVQLLSAVSRESVDHQSMRYDLQSTSSKHVTVCVKQRLIM